jgi:hypothetical protein
MTWIIPAIVVLVWLLLAWVFARRMRGSSKSVTRRRE